MESIKTESQVSLGDVKPKKQRIKLTKEQKMERKSKRSPEQQKVIDERMMKLRQRKIDKKSSVVATA